MTTLFDKVKTGASDFDLLRETLRKHLSEVLPERDHRQAIFALIDDIKETASLKANALLAARLKAALEEAPEVFGNEQMGWTRERYSLDTFRARLVEIEEMK